MLEQQELLRYDRQLIIQDFGEFQMTTLQPSVFVIANGSFAASASRWARRFGASPVTRKAERGAFSSLKVPSVKMNLNTKVKYLANGAAAGAR